MARRTGGVEPVGPVAVGQSDDPLGRAQPVEGGVPQQVLHHLGTERPSSEARFRHHTGVRMKKATFSGG